MKRTDQSSEDVREKYSRQRKQLRQSPEPEVCLGHFRIKGISLGLKIIQAEKKAEAKIM